MTTLMGVWGVQNTSKDSRAGSTTSFLVIFQRGVERLVCVRHHREAGYGPVPALSTQTSKRMSEPWLPGALQIPPTSRAMQRPPKCWASHPGWTMSSGSQPATSWALGSPVGPPAKSGPRKQVRVLGVPKRSNVRAQTQPLFKRNPKQTAITQSSNPAHQLQTV